MKNKIITMKDVAMEAGVSVMTVSRALQIDKSINSETRLKVAQAVDKLGYVLNKQAGGLSSKRSGFVAVLVPSLNNSHLATSVRIITDICRNAGLQVLLGLTDYSQHREEELVRALLSRRPEAFVLTVDGHSDATINLLKNAHIPIVEMWELPKNPINHVVGFSNYATMLQLGEYLVQNGSRKIAYVGEHHDFNTRGSARRQAYLDLLVKHNLGEPRLIETGEPPITMEQGRLAFREIIARFQEIDTIMCVSDPPAFGVVSEAKRMGYDIPSQIKVTGFGDFEISRSSYPSITTIGIDVEELGVKVGETVVASIEAMRNNVDFAQINAALAAKLIIRETA